MYSELIQTYNQRLELEKELAQEKLSFENSIAVKKAQRDDLLDKEDRLREEVLLNLEQEGKDSITEDDKLIIRQTRETKRIENPELLADDIIKNTSKIEKIIDIDIMRDMKDMFTKETVITDRKAVNDIIDKYEKVEGELLNGVTLHETKFLTIKQQPNV